MSTLAKTNSLLKEKLEKLQAAQRSNRVSQYETKVQHEERQTVEFKPVGKYAPYKVTHGRGKPPSVSKLGAKRKKTSGQPGVNSKPCRGNQNKTTYSSNSMEMVITGKLTKNSKTKTKFNVLSLPSIILKRFWVSCQCQTFWHIVQHTG